MPRKIRKPKLAARMLDVIRESLNSRLAGEIDVDDFERSDYEAALEWANAQPDFVSRLQIVEALIDEALGTCEPEEADKKAQVYTRDVVRRKFRAILERGWRT